MAIKKNTKVQQEKENKEYPLVEITLVKSTIGRTKKQRAILKGLGLGKIDSRVTREKRPEIQGMINKVDFMLQVTDVEAGGAQPKA